MKHKVEVISRETIKPSSPTPPHLSSYKLSLMDQYIGHFYVSLILFYPCNGQDDKLDYSQRTYTLKASLSETLLHFYPLAGRISSNNCSVDCNDKGAEFLEARVQSHLSQVLDHPEAEELMQFLPSECDANAPLAIQVNLFTCGGIAISVCISHKLVDACSICTFINSWASIARGDSNVEYPSFDSTSIFPSREVPILLTTSTGTPKERVASRRFVFDASSIAALKAKASSSLNQKCPSRVEAVSALLWRSTMAVAGQKQGPARPSMMSIAVNLRPRMDPPLPVSSFGNIATLAVTKPVSPTSSIAQLNELVEQLRDAIRKIDGNYVRKLADDEFLKLVGSLNEVSELCSKGEMEHYAVGSWCRFPIYEADFGWGKPFWVTICVNSLYKNVVALMDTRCGEGVEAWVTLGEEDMARFEREPELLAFSTRMA